MYGWAPAQWFPCRSDAQLVTVMKAAGQSHRKQGGGRWGVEGGWREVEGWRGVVGWVPAWGAPAPSVPFPAKVKTQRFGNVFTSK